MSLIDELAERHIRIALDNGELENLPGSGKPLYLEDDSQVPQNLRMAYRILKNAGFVPPELEQRRQALQLADLLETVKPDSEQFLHWHRRLRQLELRLQVAGIDTDFLHGRYREALLRNLADEGVSGPSQ